MSLKRLHHVIKCYKLISYWWVQYGLLLHEYTASALLQPCPIESLSYLTMNNNLILYTLNNVLLKYKKALFLLFFVEHWYCKGQIATFQQKNSDAPLSITSGMNGDLSRTIDVSLASWTASSHGRIQSRWRDSNPHRWQACDLQSAT
jgi:hypothetical protein